MERLSPEERYHLGRKVAFYKLHMVHNHLIIVLFSVGPALFIPGPGETCRFPKELVAADIKTGRFSKINQPILSWGF